MARARTRPLPPPPTSSTRAVGFALAAALGLQALGTLVPSNWTWGLATFGAWSPAGAAALFALAAVGFVPAVANAIAARFERIGRALNRIGMAADVACAAAAAVVLFLLRDPFRFVGDSSLRAQTIAYPRPPTALFPQASPLDLIVNFHLPRLLHQAGLPVEVALQAVSACVGGLFVWAVLRTLAALGVSGAARLAAALVAIAGAHLVHFAGYDKFGPVLLGIAFAALGSVQLARGRGGAAWLGTGTTIAVLSHRSGLLVVPPASWVGLRAWRAASSSQQRRSLMLFALAPLAAIAVVVPPALRLFAGLDLKVHMPGGAVQKSLASPDAPGLLVRVSDFVNGVLLVAPLLPAGIAAMLQVRRNSDAKAASRFGLAGPLLLAFALQAGLLIAVGATRGSGRDWDVVTPAGTLAAIATGAALARFWQRDRGGLGPAVTCAVAILIALFGVHVSETRARSRVDRLLHAHPAWSRTARAYAHDEIGLRAYSLRRWDEAASEFEQAIDAAPNPRYFLQLGSAHASAGRPGAALAPFRRGLALDPTMQEAWFGLANAAWALGDTVTARAIMDSAVVALPADAKLAEARRALIGIAGR